MMTYKSFSQWLEGLRDDMDEETVQSIVLNAIPDDVKQGMQDKELLSLSTKSIQVDWDQVLAGGEIAQTMDPTKMADIKKALQGEHGITIRELVGMITGSIALPLPEKTPTHAPEMADNLAGSPQQTNYGAV